MEVNAVEETYSGLWEVIVSLQYLISRLEEQQVISSNDLGNCYLSVCVGLGLKKLSDYIRKMAQALLCLALLVLHLFFK